MSKSSKEEGSWPGLVGNGGGEKQLAQRPSLIDGWTDWIDQWQCGHCRECKAEAFTSVLVEAVRKVGKKKGKIFIGKLRNGIRKSGQIVVEDYGLLVKFQRGIHKKGG